VEWSGVEWSVLTAESRVEREVSDRSLSVLSREVELVRDS
jgi:hypothetical protein